MQDILSRLSSQRPLIDAEIERGRSLLERGDAPAFVQDAVNALAETFAETTQLAQMKHQSLKVQEDVLL